MMMEITFETGYLQKLIEQHVITPATTPNRVVVILQSLCNFIEYKQLKALDNYTIDVY